MDLSHVHLHTHSHISSFDYFPISTFQIFFPQLLRNQIRNNPGQTLWNTPRTRPGNANLQSQSHWSLFNGTWQKRPRELDHRLRFETPRTRPRIECKAHLESVSLQIMSQRMEGKPLVARGARENTLQHTATHCNTQCNTLQHTATHCNTHCNTLQHAL